MERSRLSQAARGSVRECCVCLILRTVSPSTWAETLAASLALISSVVCCLPLQSCQEGSSSGPSTVLYVFYLHALGQPSRRQTYHFHRELSTHQVGDWLDGDDHDAARSISTIDPFGLTRPDTPPDAAYRGLLECALPQAPREVD